MAKHHKHNSSRAHKQHSAQSGVYSQDGKTKFAMTPGIEYAIEAFWSESNRYQRKALKYRRLAREANTRAMRSHYRGLIVVAQCKAGDYWAKAERLIDRYQ